MTPESLQTATSDEKFTPYEYSTYDNEDDFEEENYNKNIENKKET